MALTLKKKNMLRDWISCSGVKSKTSYTVPCSKHILVRNLLEHVKDHVTACHFCELAKLNQRKTMSQSLSWAEWWVSVSKVATVIKEVINLPSYLLFVSAGFSPQATDSVAQELQRGVFNEH